jgi:hypothetical protein
MSTAGWAWLRNRVGLREIAAQNDFGAHQPEKVGGNQRLVDLFRGAIFAGHEGAEAGDAADVVENGTRAGAQVEEIGVGIEKASVIRLPVFPEHQYQPIRVAVRKWPQQHGIGHAENGRAGADSQSQGYGHSRREYRALSQSPYRVGEVSDQILNSVRVTHIPAMPSALPKT